MSSKLESNYLLSVIWGCPDTSEWNLKENDKTFSCLIFFRELSLMFLSNLNDQHLDCHRPVGAAPPLFPPFFTTFLSTGTAGRQRGGVGVFLIIIDVTGITVNVVTILGSKPPQTLGYIILYILYIHIHVVYYICRGWITLYGQVCHTWAPRVTQCERVCPAPHRAWLCLVMQE